jgi:hypothetical protein
MVDLQEVLSLISELTTLLAACQKVAQMIQEHNAHVARIEARLADLSAQC